MYVKYNAGSTPGVIVDQKYTGARQDYEDTPVRDIPIFKDSHDVTGLLFLGKMADECFPRHH